MQWHEAWPKSRNDPLLFVTDVLGMDSSTPERTPEAWQVEALTALRDGHLRLSIKAGHGVGKGLEKSEPVLTPHGWRPIGELAVGDLVASVDGSFCRVKGVYPQGVRPLYRVSFDDGCSVVTDDQHLWLTRTRSSRKHGGPWRVRSTPQIAESLTFPNGPSAGLNHQIPTTAAIDHPRAMLPIDPYTLGVWLGDGSAAAGRYTKPDEAVAEELIAVGERLGAPDAGATRTIYGIQPALRVLGLLGARSHERFVPEVYRFASRSQRIALLQGILDTDGTVGKNQAVVLEVTAPRLADHVADLVRSLGGLCRRSEKDGQLNGAIMRRVYRLFIALPPEVAPFRAATKANRYRPQHEHKNRQRTPRRFVSNVEFIGHGESVCIAVDHPSRLFVTRDHIVTHNTALLSWIVLWFLLTHYPCKIPVTSNSQDQLSDIVWPELHKWHARLPPPLREQIEVQAESVVLKADPDKAFATARTASKDKPEAMQGFHAENVLFVIEEASGIEDIVFEVAQGALSTEGAIVVMVANPTRNSGFFHATHHKLRDRWYCMTVNSEDVPRARGHIADIIANYGRDSNQYRVRVLGQFPLTEDDAVIPLHLVEAAVARKGKIERVRGFAPVWGVDVAWMGSDRSALAKRRMNELLEPVKWWSGNDPHQTALRVYDEWQNTDPQDRPASICVDMIGMGAGTLLKMRELGLPARGINVGEAAPADERYMRLRDELWFRGRQWLEAQDSVMPDDRALIGELVSVHYGMSPAGKIKVESKDEMRKRGQRSPDLADAFLLTFAAGEHKRTERDLPGKYRRRAPAGTSPGWMAA